MLTVDTVHTQWGPAFHAVNVKNGVVTRLNRSAFGLVVLSVEHSIASATPMKFAQRADIRI